MRRSTRKALAALPLALFLFWAPAPAVADSYDDEGSGHPLRVAAYLVHPIGVVLDYLLFRPAHWLVHHEPLSTLLGHED